MGGRGRSDVGGIGSSVVLLIPVIRYGITRYLCACSAARLANVLKSMASIWGMVMGCSAMIGKKSICKKGLQIFFPPQYQISLPLLTLFLTSCPFAPVRYFDLNRHFSGFCLFYFGLNRIFAPLNRTKLKNPSHWNLNRSKFFIHHLFTFVVLNPCFGSTELRLI